MSVIGPVILASVILLGAGGYGRHLTRNVGPMVPEPARSRFRQASRRLPAVAAAVQRARLPARQPGGKTLRERIVFKGPSPLPRPSPPARLRPVPDPAPAAAVPLPAAAPRPAQPRPVKPAEVIPMPDPTPAISGAGADLFSAVSQIVNTAKAGGIRSKARALLMLSEGQEMMAMTLAQMARDLAEPSMAYPAVVWEPVSKAGSHVKTAGLMCAEAHAALLAMLHRALGEQLGQVPHHHELNRE